MTAAGLVLAAGAGRRLGRPKALLSIAGEPLLARAVHTLQQAGCSPIVVVLGAAAAQVQQEVRLDAAVVLVVNDAWPEGIGSSLRAGLRELTARAATAAVVLLVDQPGVPPALVRRLVDAWLAGGRAAVATFDGEQRNPVLLDSSLWPDVLAEARGDVGARGYLRAHPDIVVEVPGDDLGSPEDIDTAHDLRRHGGSPAAPD